MTVEVATLAAAVLASLVALLSMLISLRRGELKDRSLILWDREIARLMELEELVAQCKHLACDCEAAWNLKVGNRYVDELVESYDELGERFWKTIGRYSRYPAIVTAANRVVNLGHDLLVAKQKGENTDRLETRTTDAFVSFIALINRATHRHKLFPAFRSRESSDG